MTATHTYTQQSHADLPPLPEPGGSVEEVLFRRMLQQCWIQAQVPQQTQQQAQGLEPLLSDAPPTAWGDAKLHAALEALQERLYELEHGSAGSRPAPDVLQLYKAHVKSLAAQLQPLQLPPYCLLAGAGGHARAAAQQLGRGGGGGGSAHPDEAARLLQQAATSRQQQQHQQQRQQQQQASSKPAASNGGQEAPGFSLSSSAQDKLRTQQRLQDELTDELLEMGQELKASTLAMESAIRFRGKLLDEAEVALVSSAENAKAVSAKAKQQYKQGSWNLCQTCVLLLVVSCVFVGMVVAIRLTSMVGLKKQRW